MVWGSVQAGAGDLCALCGEHLYILERLCADGRFFHRSCFRCHTCEATLWPGGYRQHPEDGKRARPGVRSLQLEGSWVQGGNKPKRALSSPEFKVFSILSKSPNVGF